MFGPLTIESLHTSIGKVGGAGPDQFTFLSLGLKKEGRNKQGDKHLLGLIRLVRRVRRPIVDGVRGIWEGVFCREGERAGDAIFRRGVLGRVRLGLAEPA